MISTYNLFENQNNIIEKTIHKLPNIDINTLIQEYQTKINKSKRYLKNLGIKTDFEKFAKSISKYMKSCKDPKVVATKISKKINKIINETINILTSEKVKCSVGITILLLIINTLAFIFFGAINPTLGIVIVATVVAPIIEEYAKRLAVLDRMPWVYTSIFAGMEFSLYVVQAAFSPAMMILRIPALILHFLTTFIQERLHNYSIILNNKVLSQIGFFVGVFLHVSFNTIGILSNLN